MKITDRTRKIVVIAGAVLLIAAAAAYLAIGGKGSSVTGTWYGYEGEKLSTLTLNSDGTFIITSPVIDIPGSYTVNENVIETKDQYGFVGSKMQIVKDEAGKIVCIIEGKVSYFKTMEEADADKEERARIEKDNAIMFKSSAHQILQKADWTHKVGNKTYTVTFSEKEFVISDGSGKTEYTYEILSVEMQPSETKDLYIITWDVTREKLPYHNLKAYIEYTPNENGGEEEFELSAEIFTYSRRFTYKGNIYIEQPDIE